MRVKKIKHAQIAKAIGVHPSTITREFNRNGGARGGYDADIAQDKSVARRKKTTNASKDFSQILPYIEKLIQLDYSPVQASKRLKAEQNLSISHETIYLHIYADKEKGGNLHQHLRCQKKRRKRYGSGTDRRGVIKNQVNISQRPKIVDLKERIGDLEGDTIIGKNHKGGLVTLVDRASRFLFASHIRCKRADVVTDTIQALLEPHADRCHTITFDNGKEFAYHEQITAKLGTAVYFANPYHSWERGANENTNGVLRQYFPKGMSLLNLSGDEVQKAVNRINHRPRKILGYKSAYEVFMGTSLRYTDL